MGAWHDVELRLCCIVYDQGARVGGPSGIDRQADEENPGKYLKAVELVARNNDGRPVSGIANVSPLVRLHYWLHKAMVAMGICHLLLHNTAKKFLEAVSTLFYVVELNKTRLRCRDAR